MVQGGRDWERSILFQVLMSLKRRPKQVFGYVQKDSKRSITHPAGRPQIFFLLSRDSWFLQSPSCLHSFRQLIHTQSPAMIVRVLWRLVFAQVLDPFCNSPVAKAHRYVAVPLPFCQLFILHGQSPKLMLLQNGVLCNGCITERWLHNSWKVS